jgi:hypothetical protein
MRPGFQSSQERTATRKLRATKVFQSHTNRLVKLQSFIRSPLQEREGLGVRCGARFFSRDSVFSLPERCHQMIHGSCLCGEIRFEFSKPAGPFELCHCSRCRKVTGSAFFSGLYVRIEDFRLVQGEDLITTYEAPILRTPPAYRVSFCRRCGSPVPNPGPERPWRQGVLEIPAGLLDDDPGMKPDKHIFVERNPPWFEITDDLPQYDLPGLITLRANTKMPE